MRTRTASEAAAGLGEAAACLDVTQGTAIGASGEGNSRPAKRGRAPFATVGSFERIRLGASQGGRAAGVRAARPTPVEGARGRRARTAEAPPAP